MNKIRYILICVVLLFLILQRAYNPFEEDQKIFFASANISNSSTLGFPDNVQETFELKPLFSKMIYYGLYKVVQPLNLWDEKYEFIIAVQLVFLAFLLLAAFLFSRNSYGDKTNQNKVFFLCTFFLMTVGSESFMQVEHMAILISLYSVWFLSKKKLIFDIIAGILLGVIAGLKGITVFYSIAILVFCFFNFKKNIWIVTSVFVLTFSFSIFISWKEIETARLLQDNTLNIFRFFKQFRRTFMYIFVDQAYLASLISLMGLLLFVYIKNKSNILFLSKFLYPNILILIILLPSIFLQVGFSYHYLGLLLFLMLFIKSSLQFEGNFLFNSIGRLIALQIVIPTLLIYFFFSTMAIRHSKNLMQKNVSNFDSELSVSDSVAQIVNKNEKILFLTDGVINFYIKNVSECYEFYPITINRLMPKYPNIPKALESNYANIISCIKKFDGDYILLQTNWLPKDQYASVYPGLSYKRMMELNTIERQYVLYKKE